MRYEAHPQSSRQKLGSSSDAKAYTTELQSNTFANAFRILFDRRPISYEEIVHDVADKLDVPYQEDSSISTIEDDILLAVMINAWSKMTEQEREELSSITDIKVDIPCHIPSSMPFIALQAAIRMGGFASYQIAVIIANAVATTILGHGLRIATNAALTRSLAIFADPIGGSPQFSGVLTKAASRTCGLKVANPH